MLLMKAAEDFARATVLVDVFRAFMTATMTALEKRDGGVRGIATGTVFRRSVATGKTGWRRSRGSMFTLPVCPLHTRRSGLCRTCGASHDRRRPSCHGVVGRRDWCIRLDHVHHASMMSKLLEVPGLRTLLSFVRASYRSPSRCIGEDDQGQSHVIRQHEGEEQGDLLMPLLFSLAIHNSLAEVKAHLAEGAFLDDVIMAPPARIRFLYDLLGFKLHEGAERLERGIVEDCALTGQQLGPDVWCQCGIKILGTPVGSPEFVARLAQERLDEEEKLWNAMGARSAMCVANPRPMRGTSLPPLLADHAAESVRRTCPRPRRRHDVHRFGGTAEARSFDRVAAVEIGWSRVEVRCAPEHLHGRMPCTWWWSGCPQSHARS